ncbi:transcriptional regulator-domain-containing protein [Naematelia encephala]|uniref:Transcriptional regulator-domain-containing protein n=1 Tax=Naematelia encephala TaxID=71784 RepID=A0A1Y2BLV8_9TREE|nr:transcriptional regulator-domain-containing protein [Naematelia encephala]
MISDRHAQQLEAYKDPGCLNSFLEMSTSSYPSLKDTSINTTMARPSLSPMASLRLLSRPGPSRLPLMLAYRSQPLSTSSPLHSGHNRWSKIKHKKGAEDAKRSMLFSKYTQEIYRAMTPPASLDIGLNPRLAAAVDRAREGGVTKAAIEAIFEKARKAADGSGQPVIHEAMGPGGKEAMIIETITDAPQKTLQRLKEILFKYSCRFTPVAYLFDKKGLIVVTPTSDEGSFDELFEVAVEGGAEDVQEIEGDSGPVWEVFTEPTQLHAMHTLLSSPPHSSRYTIQSSELAYIPQNPVDEDELSEKQNAGLSKVIDGLEADADVVRVWTNLS